VNANPRRMRGRHTLDGAPDYPVLIDFGIGWRVEIDDDPGEYSLYHGNRGTVIEVDGDPMRRDSTWMESRKVKLDNTSEPARWFPKNALKVIGIIEMLATLASWRDDGELAGGPS
jgi:hypothetical protein